MYVTAWGASVQQQLARNLVGTLSYAGSTGTYLLTTSYINLIDPATGQRPYPDFGQVEYRGNNNSSSFNAFQASIQRNFTRGFSLSANYQWSHEIDNGSLGEAKPISRRTLCACPVSAPPETTTRATFSTPMPSTICHSVGAGSILPIPASSTRLSAAGSLTTIISGRTGIPVNILVDRTASSVPTGDTVNQRPDLVPGVSLTPPGGSNGRNSGSTPQPSWRRQPARRETLRETSCVAPEYSRPMWGCRNKCR